MKEITVKHGVSRSVSFEPLRPENPKPKFPLALELVVHERVPNELGAFPRLHFTTTSLAPVTCKAKGDHEAHDCRRITDDCLQPNSFFVKYSDFDVVEDKNMAISLKISSKLPDPGVRQRHADGHYWGVHVSCCTGKHWTTIPASVEGLTTQPSAEIVRKGSGDPDHDSERRSELMRRVWVDVVSTEAVEASGAGFGGK